MANLDPFSSATGVSWNPPPPAAGGASGQSTMLPPPPLGGDSVGSDQGGILGELESYQAQQSTATGSQSLGSNYAGQSSTLVSDISSGNTTDAETQANAIASDGGNSQAVRAAAAKLSQDLSQTSGNGTNTPQVQADLANLQSLASGSGSTINMDQATTAGQAQTGSTTVGTNFAVQNSYLGGDISSGSTAAAETEASNIATDGGNSVNVRQAASKVLSDLQSGTSSSQLSQDYQALQTAATSSTYAT